MIPQLNSRVTGAFLIGFAIVAGAYTVNSLNKKVVESPVSADYVANVNQAPERVAITVKDSDNDGIEDWQDEFLTAEPIVLEKSQTEYVPPDTLTGKVGVSFMQNVLTAKTRGQVGRTNEQIITNTVNQIKTEGTKDKIYSVRDVSVTKDVSENSIKNYGNAMAKAITNNQIDRKIRSQMEILDDITKNGVATEEDISDFKILSKIYLGTLNDSLNVPVPNIFLKEHLDLINVYNALYYDAEGMSEAVNDPLLALVRAKRFNDDSTGMRIALENMYLALEKSSYTFTTNDSALLFLSFAPNINKPLI